MNENVNYGVTMGAAPESESFAIDYFALISAAQKMVGIIAGTPDISAECRVLDVSGSDDANPNLGTYGLRGAGGIGGSVLLSLVCNTGQFIAPRSRTESKPIVVFVHGFIGSALGTWGDARSNLRHAWPLQLARQVSDIGVYTFDYDASPKSWLHGPMPIGTRAEELLEPLVKSPSASAGPIIFVAHSFGGLLIKEVLRKAHSIQRFADVFNRTKLCIFIDYPKNNSEFSKKNASLCRKFRIDSGEAVIASNTRIAGIVDASYDKLSYEANLYNCYIHTRKHNWIVDSHIRSSGDEDIHSARVNHLREFFNVVSAGEIDAKRISRLVRALLNADWKRLDGLDTPANNLHFSDDITRFSENVFEMLNVDSAFSAISPSELMELLQKLKEHALHQIDRKADDSLLDDIVLGAIQNALEDDLEVAAETDRMFKAILPHITRKLDYFRDHPTMGKLISLSEYKKSGDVITSRIEIGDFARIARVARAMQNDDVYWLVIFLLLQQRRSAEELSTAVNLPVSEVRKLSSEFLSLFDKVQLINSLSDWVIRRFCACWR